MNRKNWSYQKEIGLENHTNETETSKEGVYVTDEENKPFEMEGYTTLFDKAIILTPVELTIM